MQFRAGSRAGKSVRRTFVLLVAAGILALTAEGASAASPGCTAINNGDVDFVFNRLNNPMSPNPSIRTVNAAFVAGDKINIIVSTGGLLITS